jgi:flotillin
MSGTATFITVLIVAVVLIVVAALLYRRSTREVSLIRTGAGGRKVVMDGGVIAVPYFHEISRVNMRTVRLDIQCAGDRSLITQDRMRVDAGVEFYLSVDTTEEAIGRASQTLGSRTFDGNKLSDLIEGKLIDALRAVAARMTMDQLHEKRAEFVSEVRGSVAQSLILNGLVLESVSLSSMDQTPFSALDENNAFNAVGMRKLAAVIADSKKERAQIDREAEVAVHRSAMQASRHKLEIDLEEQAARLRQSQEVETLRAAQLAEIAARKADSERTSNTARIQMERDIREADIARERSVREAEIAQSQAIEEAEQDRAIALANRTEEESKALAKADLARADAATAAESITTARALADAERKKKVALVGAEQAAAVNSAHALADARSKAAVSEETAKATLRDAQAAAEAAKHRITILKSEMLAKAEGQQAMNEAENVLRDEIVTLRAELNRLQALPGIIEQMVKPAEKIDSIRVNHISGLGGGTGTGGSNQSDKPAVNQVLDSIMDMALQLPALKTIGDQIGASLAEEVGGSDGKGKTG